MVGASCGRRWGWRGQHGVQKRGHRVQKADVWKYLRLRRTEANITKIFVVAGCGWCSGWGHNCRCCQRCWFTGLIYTSCRACGAFCAAVHMVGQTALWRLGIIFLRTRVRHLVLWWMINFRFCTACLVVNIFVVGCWGVHRFCFRTGFVAGCGCCGITRLGSLAKENWFVPQ